MKHILVFEWILFSLHFTVPFFFRRKEELISIFLYTYYLNTENNASVDFNSSLNVYSHICVYVLVHRMAKI